MSSSDTASPSALPRRCASTGAHFVPAEGALEEVTGRAARRWARLTGRPRRRRSRAARMLRACARVRSVVRPCAVARSCATARTMSNEQRHDVGRAVRVSHIERRHAVAGDDVHVGAVVEKERRGACMSHARRPVQRGGLRNVPVVDAHVDGCRILLEPCRDVLVKIERGGIVQVDGAMGPQPLHDLRLVVVVGPSEWRRVERVVSVARVGAAFDEAPDHVEIAGKRRAVQRRAIVDADHVPVAVLLEEKVDRVALLADVGVEQRQPDSVAGGHLLVRAGADGTAAGHRRRRRSAAGPSDRAPRRPAHPASRQARSSSRRRAARGWPATRPGNRRSSGRAGRHTPGEHR